MPLGFPQGDILTAGTLDCYDVYAYRYKGEYFLVRAGCRVFSLKNARRHWNDVEGREDLLDGVEFLAKLAKRRGWKMELPDDILWEIDGM